jgi:putative ABC transport system permease protein
MDLIRNTWRSLRAHKLRYGLTSLGILWGALMLTLLSANMAGVVAHFHRELEEVGPKVVKAWPGYVIKKKIGERGARQIVLDADDIDRLDELESVEHIAPDMVMWSQIVRAGRRTKLLSINGVNEQTQKIRAFEVASGRFVTPTDVARKSKVAFIGAQAADRLFGHREVVGRTLQIESVLFRIIGVSVSKGDQLVGIGGSDDHVVMIPYTTMQRVFLHHDKVGEFVFAPKTREASFSAIRHAREVIGLHHDFNPDVTTAMNYMNLYEALKGVYGMMTAFQLFQLFAGIITLFVGAVGVMNIMLVVVGERRNEIGLRKAVGGTTRAIFVQFLAEAVAVSVLAGLIGAVLGIAISQGLATLMPPGTPASSPPVFDPLTLTAVVISLTIVAIVSGVAPAIRAARVPPAEALRAS